jgi:N6-adenosine-specific RNA methylase IME4
LIDNKKYNIIYADPPWSYGRWNLCKQFKGEKIHYPTMTIEEIKTLPIQEITEKDSILFLWAIYPCLQEAFEVIKAWGFNYKTVAFTWVKRNKKAPTHFIGMGNWTRANAEICLLATKGKPKRISKSVRQIIDTPIKHHSQKPTEARERIVELMGDLPRIELFAREKTQGWDVYGNEVQSDIIL